MGAAAADSALDSLANKMVDVALIDFNMPVTDGLTLAATIRQTYPHMPIAIVSANIQTEIIEVARSLTAGFVQKPVTDEQLTAFLSGASLRLQKQSR